MTCRPTGDLILFTINENASGIDMKREAKASVIFVLKFIGNRAMRELGGGERMQ